MSDTLNKETSPVDLPEVAKFNEAQLRRAKVNLEKAKQRGDTRAVANIQHKIKIYEYTIRLTRIIITAVP